MEGALLLAEMSREISDASLVSAGFSISRTDDTWWRCRLFDAAKDKFVSWKGRYFYCLGAQEYMLMLVELLLDGDETEVSPRSAFVFRNEPGPPGDCALFVRVDSEPTGFDILERDFVLVDGLADNLTPEDIEGGASYRPLNKKRKFEGMRAVIRFRGATPLVNHILKSGNSDLLSFVVLKRWCKEFRIRPGRTRQTAERALMEW